MTASERARASELIRELELAEKAGPHDRPAQFALISKMLLAYPVANASQESGRARGEAYLEAISDLSPAVIAEAIKKWHRAEAGEYDYQWAPAPGILRQICLKVAQPLREAQNDLNALISAVSLERAMDPKPLPHEIGSSLRRVV